MQRVKTNLALQKLGFSAKDRVVIIHADDIGMCQATLSAFEDLMETGLVSSGSAMVPCPWFPMVAAWRRKHSSIDLGIHLTLTSEWDNYRWGPVSTCDPSSGLLDEEGYFHRRRETVSERADAKAVCAEMKAQIDRACAAGMEPTHLDFHMYAGLESRFMPAYAQLAFDSGLPAFIWREGWKLWDAETDGLIDKWEQEGLPVFDHRVTMRSNGNPQDRIALAKKAFDEIPAGLTCFLFHPCRDAPELRAFAPDRPYRVADYEAFMSKELRDHARDSGIQLIDYRKLREVGPSAR